MIIEKAKKSDLKALAATAMATYSDAFGHTFRPVDLALYLAKNFSETYFAEHLNKDTILVAKEKGNTVGYVQFGAVRIMVEAATNRDQELQRLYVLPDFQRQGIGRSLINAALEHPRLAHAENIYLDVWDQNFSAQKLYKSYGFEIVGRNPFIIDSRVVGYDLVMIRKSA